MLTGDQQPDHASIAGFRVRHLAALAEMFVQILRLCEKAGLVKLGRVAIDGTKIKANAAKRETHRYDKLTKMEAELKEQVDQLLREAAAVDQQEDEQYGVGRRGDELPPELQDREARLKKIQAAKESLEEEARAAEKAHQERKAEEKRRRAAGDKVITRKVKKLWKKNDEGQIVPLPSRQRNLNDLDARLMKDTVTENFIPAFNPQIAVDEENQIIVAAFVTQAGNDTGQLVPALLQVEENMGRMPKQALADAGYFSPALIVDPRIAKVDLYVPPNKLPKPKPQPEPPPGTPPRKKRKPNLQNLAIRTKMREKLDQPAAKEIYRQRSKIVEPPFATIKHVRGIRQFLLRGVAKVSGEFSLICATNNVMKLFRLKPEAVMR
jgi:Transposase DDE domain